MSLPQMIARRRSLKKATAFDRMSVFREPLVVDTVDKGRIPHFLGLLTACIFGSWILCPLTPQVACFPHSTALNRTPACCTRGALMAKLSGHTPPCARPSRQARGKGTYKRTSRVHVRDAHADSTRWCTQEPASDRGRDCPRDEHARS